MLHPFAGKCLVFTAHSSIDLDICYARIGESGDPRKRKTVSDLNGVFTALRHSILYQGQHVTLSKSENNLR